MRSATGKGGRHRGLGPAGGVRLAWARDRDGLRVSAEALDPARRRERAPFACPGCGEPLTPRLGKVRARHFAHRPGSACPLTAPETALHWNAKERLLALCEEAFAGREVRLLARCPGCRRLVPDTLVSFGDSATSEGSVGALRADVLVLRRGRPSLALEVRVSHAVDPAKEAALAAAGVPALEVDAREEWLREAGGAAEVVPVRSLGFPRCGACQAADRAQAGRAEGGEAAAVAELEAYRARGLFGPPPGRAAEDPPPIGERDRARIARAFACAACGGEGPGALDFGVRLVRHPCPRGDVRPVAWRGYDGRLVELTWWKRK